MFWKLWIPWIASNEITFDSWNVMFWRNHELQKDFDSWTVMFRKFWIPWIESYEMTLNNWNVMFRRILVPWIAKEPWQLERNVRKIPRPWIASYEMTLDSWTSWSSLVSHSTIIEKNSVVKIDRMELNHFLCATIVVEHSTIIAESSLMKTDRMQLNIFLRNQSSPMCHSSIIDESSLMQADTMQLSPFSRIMSPKCVRCRDFPSSCAQSEILHLHPKCVSVAIFKDHTPKVL